MGYDNPLQNEYEGRYQRVTVPCGLCGIATPMTATKRCDRCWELERRIESDPALARKILDRIERKGE